MRAHTGPTLDVPNARHRGGRTLLDRRARLQEAILGVPLKRLGHVLRCAI